MSEKTDIEKMIAPARHSLQHVPLTESMVIGGTIGKLQRALEEKDAVIKELTGINVIDKDKLVEFIESEIMSARIVGTGSDKAIEWECRRILERINAGIFDKSE
ncbi:hypothetical protein J23TS9_06580 [Paenibacillus sp. J23TS9]|uniref:hypothetical protein n=1 Tax=Paenibacillus sp. J23TS9 TaxID=2807193 RepID=UPI001B2D0D46|nr:hypothetical protein [Paenibacillus sp. J23TS9]GIP25528.1 hypothetical protein J23TS9_06580 [Paenibacillus sp. J23TS9]